MPRPNVSTQRKTEIVEAALRVFARRGFHDARMEEIAQEAGLSVGGVYWYYKGKDEIVTALMAHLFESDLRDLQTLMKGEGSTRARVLAFVDHMAEEFSAMAPLISIVYDYFAKAMYDQAVRRSLRDYLAGYRDALANLVEQGVAAGEFGVVESRDVAGVVIAIFDGLALHWTIDPKTVVWRKSFRLAVELILDGLQARRMSTHGNGA